MSIQSIPFQILRNCHTNVFNIIQIFEDCSFYRVNCIDLFDPLPSKLHNVTFHGLKSHTPFLGLFAQLINILLEFRCVFSAVNLMIADTVISEQTNPGLYSNYNAIYIQGNSSGLRTVPCDTLDKTGSHCEFAPLITTLCCLLHRNDSIHTKVFPLMPYPWSLHFRSSRGGVSKAF